MRVLAIDLGDVRTGIALGDRVTGVAAPAGLIEVRIEEDGGESLIRAIAGQVRENLGGDPSATVVMGMPINMDGSEGSRAKMVRLFAGRVARAIGRAILLVDERRTSVEADGRMARTGLTHKQKKRRRDAIAAAAIVRVYLEDTDAVLGTVEPSDDGNDPGA